VRTFETEPLSLNLPQASYQREYKVLPSDDDKTELYSPELSNFLDLGVNKSKSKGPVINGLNGI
jgi:hypothetical protein